LERRRASDQCNATAAAPVARDAANWNPDPQPAPLAPPPSTGVASADPGDLSAPPLASDASAPQGRVADSDPWKNIGDERLRSGGESARAGAAGVGSSVSPFSTTAGTGQGAQPLPQLVPPAGGTPMITSSMLDQLATRPLDDLNPNAASKSALCRAAHRLHARERQRRRLRPSYVSAPARAAASQQTCAKSVAMTSASAPVHETRGVFLHGCCPRSAAGNIYLFWSYLDVRTKYRALVRKTARAVGSRFSAA
jgi:hypothetical protein